MPIIKLPRKRLIAMDRDSITIDMPDKPVKRKNKKVNMDVINKVKGILQDKSDDLLKYAKEVRDEWE